MKWSGKRLSAVLLAAGLLAAIGCGEEPAANPPAPGPVAQKPSGDPGPAEPSGLAEPQPERPGPETQPGPAEPSATPPPPKPPDPAGGPVWDPLAAEPGTAATESRPPGDAGPPKKTDPTASEREKKMSVDKQPYGKMPDGTEVDRYTLTNTNGLKVKMITYGAMITAVELPDRNGKFANVTLFRDSLEDYLADHPFFGCAVGRYANRIAKGKFTLD
ncbi:MAG: aldose epimerase family protein, partial [Planctomycetota bacterium]